MPLDDDPPGAAGFAAGHTFGPDQFGGAVGTERIEFGMAVTEDMDMSRLVIVDEDNPPKPGSESRHS